MYEVIVIQKSYQLWNFLGFLGPISPKTLLKESYPARARQVRWGRSWKQQISCGTGSSRVVSQGLSCLLLKTFATDFSWPNWPPLSLRGWTLVLMWEANLVLNFFLFLQASYNVCRTLVSKMLKLQNWVLSDFESPIIYSICFPNFA